MLYLRESYTTDSEEEDQWESPSEAVTGENFCTVVFIVSLTTVQNARFTLLKYFFIVNLFGWWNIIKSKLIFEKNSLLNQNMQ